MSNATLIARPLTAEAFAPYGHAIELPKSGKVHLVAELVNARKGRADARLALTAIEPIVLPYEFNAMEAHEHSPQAFVPVDVSRHPGGCCDFNAGRQAGLGERAIVCRRPAAVDNLRSRHLAPADARVGSRRAFRDFHLH